jgi:hypothetical protein
MCAKVIGKGQSNKRRIIHVRQGIGKGQSKELEHYVISRHAFQLIANYAQELHEERTGLKRERAQRRVWPRHRRPQLSF